MHGRRILVTLSALLLSLALGAPAIVGGWAATTLDEVPDELDAEPPDVDEIDELRTRSRPTNAATRSPTLACVASGTADG